MTIYYKLYSPLYMVSINILTIFIDNQWLSLYIIEGIGGLNPSLERKKRVQ